MPNVLSPRDLVSRPDNMDETVLSSSGEGYRLVISECFFRNCIIRLFGYKCFLILLTLQDTWSLHTKWCYSDLIVDYACI